MTISLEDIQNISLFTISICVFFSYLYYNISYKNTEYLSLPYNDVNNVESSAPLYDMLYPFVGVHAFIDFFVNKSYDLKLHHLFILSIIFYNNYYNVSSDYRFIFLYPLLNTEISSIFYVLKYWLPKKTIIYNANMVFFYLSFFKFRIYDFYYKIIQSNASFGIVFQKYSQQDFYLSFIFLISCYGLYVLNLYWFLIINKILYKNIAKVINIDTDALCHLLCSYTHWINIPLSCYIYLYNPNEKYIFDMVGITILSISSYQYHYDIYSSLCDKKIEEYDLPNKDNIILFINDCMCIHIRSFLVVVTNYYNSQHLFYILFISGIFHIGSIYHSIVNIIELFIDYKPKETFLNCHQLLCAIPIACDVFFVFINSPNEISVPFLIVNTIIALLFMVDPFYKLTHVAFHLCLIAQNYYMSLSSSIS